jgi:hypothetical protein
MKAAGSWLAAVVVTTFTSGTASCSRSQQRPSSAAYAAGASLAGRQKVSELASFQTTTSFTSPYRRSVFRTKRQ